VRKAFRQREAVARETKSFCFYICKCFGKQPKKSAKGELTVFFLSPWLDLPALDAAVGPVARRWAGLLSHHERGPGHHLRGHHSHYLALNRLDASHRTGVLDLGSHLEVHQDGLGRHRPRHAVHACGQSQSADAKSESWAPLVTLHSASGIQGREAARNPVRHGMLFARNNNGDTH
jgi:hypothetical protein